MPKLSVSQRLRGRLKILFDKYGWGTKAALSRYSHRSPVGTKLHPQDISNFINESPGRTPIDLDNLDDIAAFFDCSIGELLGETRLGDLSGNEQRMVYAFRALPLAVQENFLSLIEQASLAPRFVGQTTLRAGKKRATRADEKGDDDAAMVHSGHSVRATGESDPATALAALRAFLTSLLPDIADAAAGSIPDRQVSDSLPDKASDRGVAE